MNPLKKALLEFIEPQRLLEGEPMGEHTTFRVGGRAFFPAPGRKSPGGWLRRKRRACPAW